MPRRSTAKLAAADPPIDVACAGTTSGTTFTLTADCATTATLTVPDGFTVDGAGHTISATDSGGAQWNGAIVTNAGASMHIVNLTVTGPAGGFQLCTQSTNVLYGIYFNGAGGSVSNVVVDHIYQQQNGAFGSCQTGRAIRAESATARTVTITGTTVTDYQKTGFEARGSMTMEVTGSTAGPPHPMPGLIAQNGVTFVNVSSGSLANNTIHGSGDQANGPGGNANGTAVLLFNSNNVTVTQNHIVGEGTDIGIAVAAGSTGNTISFNDVTRQTPDTPNDPTGTGISVDSPASSATLICNTFSLWNQNVVGAIQIACTPLPDGVECHAYSAHTPAVEGGTEPFTWSLESASLPPGLALASDGAITGTPTTKGTYDFTLRATDSAGLTATQDRSITVAPGCQTPTTTPTPGPTVSAEKIQAEPSGELAFTGAQSGPLPMLIAALVLLAAGLALTVIAVRRGGTGEH